ncbi:hypothetical protein CHS0354_010423, partial [Potamilus streckersoni]
HCDVKNVGQISYKKKDKLKLDKCGIKVALRKEKKTTIQVKEVKGKDSTLVSVKKTEVKGKDTYTCQCHEDGSEGERYVHLSVS